jgi:hypothetical protein
MSPFPLFLMQFAILAYALLGGVFLAFSDFIMRSLSLTGGTGGVEAMQVINREVFRWVFMVLFLGMAAASLVIAGYAVDDLLERADERSFGRDGPNVRVHARLLDRHLPPALDLLEHSPNDGLRAVCSLAALRALLDDASSGPSSLTDSKQVVVVP